ncbi:MAG: sigma-70 family RNA polymerase sigma factor [Sedimentisphaerales bacterium]|nr:sigma-70 family RNA polymerase sigma factor [Sedimentisphaerales bacterium]
MSSENNILSAESQRADEQLIVRCRKDDSMAAFGELVEKYQDRLFNMILRMTGNYDDAQELTQESFCRALRSLSRFRGGSIFYTWLYRIALNLCIDYKGKKQKLRIVGDYNPQPGSEHQARNLFDLMESREPLPVDAAINKDDYHRVLAAIESLEGQDRAILLLREVEQLDYKHISRILEVPVGTVKSRLARARLKLSEKLI